MRKLFVMLGIAAVTVGATSAFGASLISIGVLDETPPAGSPESAVNALTPDGGYAVGYSNAGNLADTATINQPIIWSVGDGLVELPNPDDIDAQATGVVIRPLLSKIGVGGNVNGMMQYYNAFQSNLASGTWLVNVRGSEGLGGPYNTARLANPIFYTPPSYYNPWFFAGHWTGGEGRGLVNGVPKDPGEEVGSNIASVDFQNTGGGVCVGHSCCKYKWTAGYDHGNPGGQRRALFMNSNNGTIQTVIPGGSGIRSKAYGINADGTVLCGYDTDDEALTTNQAFVWKTGDANMTLLGTLGSDADSIGITVNVDGSDYIVAGSSTGTNEEAVVWDTTGTWDSTGTAKTLTSLLTTAGVDCSAWTRLTSATAMSDSGTVIAGYGVWAADGSTRGFVASLSTPPSVSSAKSVKTHGTTDYEIDVLDRTDDGDVECRKYGVTKLVVGFDVNIQGVGGLGTSDVAVAPMGVVDGVSLSASNELTIDISNTMNGVPLTVTFPGIANASDASALCADSVCIRQLLGDVRTDSYMSVNASDRVDVRDEVGLVVTGLNFRTDIIADGAINAADRIAVRDAVGSGFVGTCP